MGEVWIPSGSMAVEAEYKEQIIPDYKDNPFIEALPSLMAPDEVIEKLAFYPQYNSSERQLESHYRIHMIDRMFQVFQPLPMSIELESKIARAVRQGYLSRNPFGRELVWGFRQDYYRKNNINLSADSGFYSSSLGFTLIGISGLGKTSSLQRILNLYPQILVHSEYKNMHFSVYQVVWMKLECPHDGSIKGLLYEFFSETDRLLGTNYYQKMMKIRATTDAMMTVMNQVVRNCSLGLLVIDEIQHLSMAKSGGSEKMLNFFVNLVNNVGVPVILVGTPKAIAVFQGDFRQARRGAGPAGDMICDRIQKDGVWDLLVNSIWRYQWTRKETPLTPEINNVLYEETQGIPDLLKKVYGIAQAYAISTGKEEITPYIIKKVAKQNLKLVQPMLTALKTGNVREIAKFEDICMLNINFNGFLTRTKQSITLDLKAKAIKKQEKEQKKEDMMDKKKEAVLKLIDLGFDAKKAQKTIDKMDYEQGNENVSINSIVLDAIKLLTDGEKKNKASGEGKVKYDASDIRYIVEQGKKYNKSAYESLLEKGYIKTFQNDVFSFQRRWCSELFSNTISR
jgi:hypothetical protein